MGARVFPILKSVKSVFIRGKVFAFSWDFSASPRRNAGLSRSRRARLSILIFWQFWQFWQFLFPPHAVIFHLSLQTKTLPPFDPPNPNPAEGHNP
jgi:hypothetical protein